MNNFKLSTKLITLFLLIGIIPASITSIFTLIKIDETLLEDSFKKLVSIREMKKNALEDLFTLMENQVVTLAENPLTIEAMKEFKSGFSSYATDFSKNRKITEDEIKESNINFYFNQFSKKYIELNKKGKQSQLTEIVNSLSKNSQLLQYSYITQNTNPLGQKHLLEYAADNTPYSQIHKKYHPSLKSFIEKFSYYDMFLVDSETGYIVYSTFKELDFATSLISGPYSRTGLGKVFMEAKDAPRESTVITDIEPYFPSYDSGASFMATPIYDGMVKIGVLIFQIPVDKLDVITTSSKKWKENGMGRSGEAFLVGPDYKMRSISRFLVEEPDAYYDMIRGLGLNEELISNIKNKKTSALYQEVKTEGTTSALQGKTGVKIFEDYRGVKVISAFTPFEFRNLKWALLTEIDQEEALESISYLKKIIFSILVPCLMVIALIALSFSKMITKPVIMAAEALGLRGKDLSKLSDGLVSASNQLSASSSEQASATQESVSAMEEMSSMISQTSEFAKSSQELAEEVRGKTDDGDRIMKQLVSSMELIQQANNQLQNMTNIINDISGKTNVINDIVFKTQLLSFNASIEAARAGQHGKGFAVVAEEVGNLARMSGKAAEEIKTLIQDSQNQVKQIVNSTQTTVEEGQEVSSQALRIFQDISHRVNSINEQIRRINEASNEQREGVKQTSLAIKQMDEAAKNNESIAHEALKYSKELSGLNKGIFEVMKVLRLMVSGTLEEKPKKKDEDTLESFLEKRQKKIHSPHSNLSLIQGKKAETDKEASLDEEVANLDPDGEEFEKVKTPKTGTHD